MHQTTAIFSKLWIQALREDISIHLSSSSSDYQELQTLQWIAISWVFENETVFTVATGVAQFIAESDFAVQIAEATLPIPQSVIGS